MNHCKEDKLKKKNKEMWGKKVVVVVVKNQTRFP